MKREIDYIVIHCTATPQTATVQSIQNHWRNVLKWNSPGYHILIEANGKKHYLQPFNLSTNGVRGYNKHSIHISYIGGVDSNGRPIDNRTQAQKQAILESIREALAYSGKGVIIQGHRDFPAVAKACPSFDAKSEYKSMSL